RRAGDAGEIARRAVHAGKGRIVAKYSSHVGAGASNDAAGPAISDGAEFVDEVAAWLDAAGPVLEGNLVMCHFCVGKCKEAIADGGHGSLLRMTICGWTIARDHIATSSGRQRSSKELMRSAIAPRYGE